MTIKVVEVGSAGLEYVRASLLEGLVLARSAGSTWPGSTAVALIPSDAPKQRVLDFRRGGLGRLDFTMAARLLKDAYPNALLLVELPLSRPGDPEVPDDGVQVVVRGSDVYAVCRLSDSPSKIEATLRSTDPSVMYNALILGNENEIDSGDEAPPMESINLEQARIMAVLAGAFDGEGFILAASRENASKLGVSPDLGQT